MCEYRYLSDVRGTYCKDGGVSCFIGPDDLQLLHGHLARAESSSLKIGGAKLGQHFSVELRLELLEHIRESCVSTRI